MDFAAGRYVYRLPWEREAGVSDSLLDAFLDEGAVFLTTKREIHLAIRRDGKPNWDPVLDPLLGDGSVENPLDAGTREKLDRILASGSSYMLPSTRFVFGPGVFRTAGIQAWEPLAGQEFVGSGMYATTLLDLPVLR